MSVLFRNLVRFFSATSTPAAGTGDAWWRSDLSQLHASDGGSSPLRVGPFGNLPVVRSGAWHSLPPQGAIDSFSVPDGRLFALPLWPGRSGTLTATAIDITLALVGGTVRMGLYESDGSLPSNLIADYGTVSTAIAGIQQINGLSTPLRPSLHFFVACRQGGALSLNLAARATRDGLVSDASPALDDRTAYFRDGVTGALPDPFGAIAGTAQGPAAVLQIT